MFQKVNKFIGGSSIEQRKYTTPDMNREHNSLHTTVANIRASSLENSSNKSRQKPATTIGHGGNAVMQGSLVEQALLPLAGNELLVSMRSSCNNKG